MWATPCWFRNQTSWFWVVQCGHGLNTWSGCMKKDNVSYPCDWHCWFRNQNSCFCVVQFGHGLNTWNAWQYHGCKMSKLWIKLIWLAYLVLLIIPTYDEAKHMTKHGCKMRKWTNIVGDVNVWHDDARITLMLYLYNYSIWKSKCCNVSVST